MMLTPENCRAGRALLGISQEDLARRALVARATLSDFEQGTRQPLPVKLRAIESALVAAGVDLMPGGAALRGSGNPGFQGNTTRRLAGVLRVLQSEAQRFRNMGVQHLSVFGSTARGEDHLDSDVDLIVDLDPDRRLDIFDLAGIAAELEVLLGLPVDLVRRKSLKPHVAEQAQREEIRAF